MNPSESSDFVKRAYKNVAEEAAKHSRHAPANVLPDVYHSGMMQQPQYALGLPGGFQYPPAGQYPQGLSPYPFPAPGMGGMPSHPYPFAGQGQTHTFETAHDVVTLEQYNRRSEMIGAGFSSLQRQVNQVTAHLVAKDGYKPEKQAFDASNLRAGLQLQSSSKKRIADQPPVDDDELEAKIEEIMKAEPGISERAARDLAMTELTKPTTKKARPAKVGAEFDYPLWGKINLQRGRAEVCPDLIAKVASIDKSMLTTKGALKATAMALIDANKQYWGYAQMMPDPITPADQASLDEFVKLKIAHGFPAAHDWNGEIP
jgi:hypothetical protein